MGKRLLPLRTKKKTSLSPASPRSAARVSIPLRRTLGSAPAIELDPDVDIHPEDWVTHVDADPFALTHDTHTRKVRVRTHEDIPHDAFTRATLTYEDRADDEAPSFFDVIDDLFRTIRDLPFCETTAEAASFCLAAAMRTLPSRIGLAHVYDAEARQFVVVYAQGSDSEDVLMMRTDEGDPLIQSAMEQGAPRSSHYGHREGGDERPRNRHAFFGPVRSVLVAPVVHKKRPLGVIELIDPLDGSFFDARAENTLSHVAGRLAEHLASRGIAIGQIVAPRLDPPSASGDFPAARPTDLCRAAAR